MKEEYVPIPHSSELRTQKRRGRQILHTILAIAFILFFITSFCRQYQQSLAYLVSYATPALPLRITRVLKALYEPILVPVNAPEFRDLDGKEHPLNNSVSWTSSQHQKVCIVDLFRGEQKDPAVSAGLLNHYAYASIHGYIHKNMSVGNDFHLDNLFRISGTLFDEGCHTVVFLECSLGLKHLNLPFEWLFNHWGMTKATTVAWTAETYQLDSVDFAFVVMQRVPGQHDAAWYKDCVKGKKGNPSCKEMLTIPSADIPVCATRGCEGVFAQGGYTFDDLELDVLGGGVFKDLVPRLYGDYTNQDDDKAGFRRISQAREDVQMSELLEGRGANAILSD